MSDQKLSLAALRPLAAALAALSLLAACAPLPKLAEPARAYQGAELGLKNESSAALTALHSDWWRAYGDAALDALLERALASHPSLAQAQARIARAGAGIENAQAADRPTVGVGADITRQRYTEHGLVPPPVAGSVRTSANLQAGISYDWDFFGRHAAALQAAVGQERAAQADAAAARLNLSSALVRSWLDLGRVLAQRELLAEQLRQGEQSLALVRQRVQAGLDNAPVQRSAELPLPELRRQDLALQAQAELLRHQLAALSAQPQEAVAALQPRLPQALNLGSEGSLGVDLLGRRPDVVAARWRVEAATQGVAEARAQFYPNVNLTAFAGFNSLGLDQLLKSGSRQLGFGPSLRLPIFDTGRLRAQLKGNAAELDGAVAAYNGALLEALREASDQLSLLDSLARQDAEQTQTVAHLQASRDLARQRYEAGLGNYLAVLSAEQNLLQQRRSQLELQAQRLGTQVALVRSLGGGWNEAAAPMAQAQR